MWTDKKEVESGKAEERSYVWCADVASGRSGDNKMLVCVSVVLEPTSVKMTADVPTWCIRIEDCTAAPPYIISNRSHSHTMWFEQKDVDGGHKHIVDEAKAENRKRAQDAAQKWTPDVSCCAKWREV